MLLVTMAPRANAASSYPKSHTLNLSFFQDPGQPPDPDVFYGSEGWLIVRNVYQGLLQYQPGTAHPKIVADLATSWSESSNGLSYTFHLRHGVLFHDGTPFTSAAIAPDFARRTAVDGGPAYMVSDVANVATPDPYTAVITLKQPNSAFLSYLASSYGPMMESPAALAAHAGNDNDQTYLATHDIGTGPYVLTRAQVGQDYQLKAFPKYWGHKPYYTTVNIPVLDDQLTQQIQFDDGQIAVIMHDLSTSAIAHYKTDKNISFYSLPTFQVEQVYVNPHRGFLTSQSARTALLKAINVKSIVATAFNGDGHSAAQALPAGLLPPSMGQQKIHYSTAPLKSIVGHLGSSEKDITIGYDNGAAADQLVAEMLGDQLQALGLTVNEEGYDTSTVFGWADSLSAAEHQAPNILVYYNWPDTLNTYSWNHTVYDSTGGVQYFSCTVPGVDALDASAVTTGSNALYSKAISLAVKSGCWLNLADRNDVMVAQKWLKGIPQAHVYSMPYALLLDGLYPG
jgi:peptide/nickel transport system substrate-binding protein